MKNLFDIQEEYLMALEELEQYFLDNPDAEGEIPDEINERLNINKDEIETKIGNFYLWIEELKAQIDALKLQEKRLATKRKTKENTIARIKQYIGNAVKLYGDINVKSKSKNLTKFIQSGDVKATWIINPTVVVKDIEKVPEVYRRYSLQLTSALTPLQAKNLEDYLSTREIPFDTILGVDKKQLETALETVTMEGAVLDKSGGYVKFT